jgi:hypothetical protein
MYRIPIAHPKIEDHIATNIYVYFGFKFVVGFFLFLLLQLLSAFMFLLSVIVLVVTARTIQLTFHFKRYPLSNSTPTNNVVWNH